jgi:hypothetical protein
LACETAHILTLAVTTTPKAWDQNRIWTSGKRHIHSAVGLHPELVGDRHAEIELLERLMVETPFIGGNRHDNLARRDDTDCDPQHPACPESSVLFLGHRSIGRIRWRSA